SIKGMDRLLVDSPPFGRQSVAPSLAPDGARTVYLTVVGRLKGRIVTGDPASARGLRVRVLSSNQASTGIAEVTTDADGRFDIPALAGGETLRAYLIP